MSQISINDAQTWSLSGELSFATVTTLLTEFKRSSNLPQVIALKM